jgi:hypothetical protein
MQQDSAIICGSRRSRRWIGGLGIGLGHGDFGEAAVRELQGSLTARWLIATVSNHGGCRAGSNSKTLARPPRLLSRMATLSLCSLGLFCVDRPAGLTDANAMRACCFACGRRIPLPARWPIIGVVWYYYLILLLADAILSIDTIIMHLTTPIYVVCYGPMDKCCLHPIWTHMIIIIIRLSCKQN